MVTKKSPSAVAIKGKMAAKDDIWPWDAQEPMTFDGHGIADIKPGMWHVTYLIPEMQKQFEMLQNGQRGGKCSHKEERKGRGKKGKEEEKESLLTLSKPQSHVERD